MKWIKTIDSHIFVHIDGKYLWVFKLLGTGRDDGVLQFDGHECTNETMVDSNEMFVNEAIHQGTDMRHPMCPNAIFRIPKKGHKNSCCCSSSFLWGENNSHECTPLPIGLRKCPNIESTYYYYSIYYFCYPRLLYLRFPIWNKKWLPIYLVSVITFHTAFCTTFLLCPSKFFILPIQKLGLYFFL